MATVISLLRKRLESLPPGVHNREWCALMVAVAKESNDIVAAQEVLQHSDDPLVRLLALHVVLNNSRSHAEMVDTANIILQYMRDTGYAKELPCEWTAAYVTLLTTCKGPEDTERLISVALELWKDDPLTVTIRPLPIYR